MIMQTVFCDKCNPEGRHHTGRGEVEGDRARAYELGWIRRKGQDICSECLDDEREAPA